MEHTEPCPILFLHRGKVGQQAYRAESNALEEPQESKPKWGIEKGTLGLMKGVEVLRVQQGSTLIRCLILGNSLNPSRVQFSSSTKWE